MRSKCVIRRDGLNCEGAVRFPSDLRRRLNHLSPPTQKPDSVKESEKP